MMEYILEYTPLNHVRRHKIRMTVLALCVVMDIVALGLIFSAVIDPYVWIAVVMLPVASFGLRYYINRYPKVYDYGTKLDRFFIDEVTPIKTNHIVDVAICEIQTITLADNIIKSAVSTDKSILVLCDNSCLNDVYVLKLRDKSIIIPLDEYLYTSLLRGIRG